MKYRVLLVFVFSSLALMANGELTKKQTKWLEDLDVPGIRTKTERDDNRKKRFLIEIETSQTPNEDNIEEGFRIRIVVEVVDKAKNTYIIDFTGNRPEMDYAADYSGEDYWTMYLPFGDLIYPKISGIAIQYGFMDGDTFVPFAEEVKARGVKTADALAERTKTPYPQKPVVKWYYVYDDQTEGTTDSIPRDVRPVRIKKAAPVAEDKEPAKEADSSGSEE